MPGTNKRGRKPALGDAPSGLRGAARSRGKEIQLAGTNNQLRAEIAEGQQAEVQLRPIIDTIPAMVFTALPDGFVDYINQRWRQFLGLGVESVQGWSWDTTIHPEDRARSIDHWRATMAAGQPSENELRVRRADGVYRWILGRFVPLCDESGKIVKWCGVSTDIDDRKRAEQAVQESQQLLHMVLATLPVGVAVTDRAGDIVLANPASKRIWGDVILSGRERWAQSKGFWHDSGKMVDPESWASARALFEGQTSLNELIDIETFDGRQKTIQNSAAPIRDAEGLILGAVVVNEDVTERVRAEKALRESERQLGEAQRLAHVGSWEWDLRSNAVTWSDELYRIFGVEPQEIDVAREAMEHIHPDDRDLILRDVENTLKTKEPYSFSYRVLRPDEQMRFVQSCGQVVIDSEGTPIKVFGTTQDVTENKRAEESLRDSADRLQHLSRRLLEVQEEERRHLARELHDEFGQLLAATTLHLHAAKGLVGEAARSCLEECAALLERAGREVRSLALELRPTMLETSGVEATLRWLAKQHEQQKGLAVQVSGHVDGVCGDLAIACFRVAQEALTNVARHARAQHVWIELSQSESVLELVVRDDGAGFDVPRALERATHEGHLGLLGMRERVQILAGGLEVDSTPGRGTRIRVSFPLAEARIEPAGSVE
jgi:PAS domain S-box-containing protein